MRQLGIGLLILLCVMGYWDIRVYQKTQYLTEFSQPFVAACLGTTGCIVAPDGWTQGRTGSYYKEGMIYTTHDDEFSIDWHIATGVHLMATGGKSKSFSVERQVD